VVQTCSAAKWWWNTTLYITHLWRMSNVKILTFNCFVFIIIYCHWAFIRTEGKWTNNIILKSQNLVHYGT